MGIDSHPPPPAHPAKGGHPYPPGPYPGGVYPPPPHHMYGYGIPPPGPVPNGAPGKPIPSAPPPPRIIWVPRQDIRSTSSAAPLRHRDPQTCTLPMDMERPEPTYLRTKAPTEGSETVEHLRRLLSDRRDTTIQDSGHRGHNGAPGDQARPPTICTRITDTPLPPRTDMLHLPPTAKGIHHFMELPLMPLLTVRWCTRPTSPIRAAAVFSCANPSTLSWTKDWR